MHSQNRTASMAVWLLSVSQGGWKEPDRGSLQGCSAAKFRAGVGLRRRWEAFAEL